MTAPAGLRVVVSPMGHALGVRVQRVQRGTAPPWVVAACRRQVVQKGCAGRFPGLTGLWAGGFLGLTAPAGLRVVVSPMGHAFGVRVQKVQRVQRVHGHACGVRVQRVQKVQRVQRVMVAAPPQFYSRRRRLISWRRKAPTLPPWSGLYNSL